MTATLYEIILLKDLAIDYERHNFKVKFGEADDINIYAALLKPGAVYCKFIHYIRDIKYNVLMHNV